MLSTSAAARTTRLSMNLNRQTNKADLSRPECRDFRFFRRLPQITTVRNMI
ncbi:MAG: hypothetical protein WKF71_01930 [Pyrinomonadaceae bacterium]